MTPKEDIIKSISEQMEIPSEIVEKVISWSYMKANNAVKNKKEIEMSGLGKFMVSKAKLKRRIDTIENNIKTNPNPQRVIELEEELEFVKTKCEQTDRIPETITEGSKEPRESNGGDLQRSETPEQESST